MYFTMNPGFAVIYVIASICLFFFTCYSQENNLLAVVGPVGAGKVGDSV